MNEDQLRDELLETQRQLGEARTLSIKNESKYRELAAFCRGFATSSHIQPIINFIDEIYERY